jgi:transposase-like protein
MSRRCQYRPADFKLAAIERMAGAPNIAVLARELGVQRERLYEWRAKYRAAGLAGLRSRGRPASTEAAGSGGAASTCEPPAAPAEARIAALERKIGQQQLELDFFRAALQRVRAPRRSTGGPGETASTR